MRSVVLYKSSSNHEELPSYWEAWEEPNGLFEHWGQVGDEGEMRDWSLGEADFDALVQKARSDGYGEPPEHTAVVVQIPTLGGWPTNDEVELRWRIESLLDDALGWLGNGFCDGGDAGSGTMNVFCYVIDRKAGVATIVETLRTNRLLERLVVAVHDDDSEELHVAWPEAHPGNFSLF